MADIFIGNATGIEVTARSMELEGEPYDTIKLVIETPEGTEVINIIGKDGIKLPDLNTGDTMELCANTVALERQQAKEERESEDYEQLLELLRGAEPEDYEELVADWGWDDVDLADIISDI